MTVPSSFISSASTPTGGKPASRQRSTQASVWPERISTPPSLRHQRKHVAGPHEVGRAAVAVGERAHRIGALLSGNAGGKAVAGIDRNRKGGAQRGIVARHHRVKMQAPRLLLTQSGAQTMPEVWRMMKAIFSGVHIEAATNRSPSFSRSSSSATTTISPRAKAVTTAWMRCRAYVHCLLNLVQKLLG